MFGSSSPLLRLPLLLCGFVLFCGVPSPSWSQAFEDSATYQVKGAELNKLSEDLQTAKSELATLQTRNEQLEKDSASKAKALAELQTQLTTVSTSFQKSQNEALTNLLEAIGVTFLVTIIVDESAHGTGLIK